LLADFESGEVTAESNVVTREKGGKTGCPGWGCFLEDQGDSREGGGAPGGQNKSLRKRALLDLKGR